MIFASDCLAGRRILVTGASSGLGRVTALLIARCGGRVALMARNVDRLYAALADLPGDGHSVHEADLSDAEVTAEAVTTAAKDGGSFAGMFHSAGTTKVLPIKLLKNKHLDEVFGAGVRGAFGLGRAATRRGVLEDGGAIVMMSSVASVCGRPALSSYCAAKAAVDGLVRSLSVEFADRAIRVNSITAGAVETEMHQEFVGSISDAAARDYANFHPLGFGKPMDIANMAVFLLSDGGRWITGAAMAVDGGAAAK